MTVNRALRELATEGYLIRLQGVGTFVAPRKTSAGLLEIKSIGDEIRERGGEHTSEVILLKCEKTFPDLAVLMGLKLGAPVYHSTILHKENGTPVQYEGRYVNPDLAPEYLNQDFKMITPSEYLLAVAPLTEAEHIIEASMPNPNIRKLLRMKPKEPCLILHRRTWAHNLVVTKSRFVYPASRYQLGGRFRPTEGIPWA